MTFRTFFLVRAVYGREPVVDSRVTYASDGVAEAIQVEQVAARLQDTAPDIGEVMSRFPEAAGAVRAYSGMELRKRYNNDIFGPFNVLSEDDPSDDDLVEWWKARRK